MIKKPLFRWPEKTPQNGYIFRHALANLGAMIAFLPLITYVMQGNLNSLAFDGTNSINDNDVTRNWSIILIAGAITATLANIISGKISDNMHSKGKGRFIQMRIALPFILLSYVCIALANSLATLMAAFIFFQIAFNLFFAPLQALFTDYIPNKAKGFASSLVNIGLPLAGLSIVIIAIIIYVMHRLNIMVLDYGAMSLVIIGIFVLLCVMPLLIWENGACEEIDKTGQSDTTPHKMHISDTAAATPKRMGDFTIACFARFAIQCTAVLVFSYGYYLFVDYYHTPIEPVDGKYAFVDDSPRILEVISAINMIVMPLAVIAILAIGRMSDTSHHRKKYMVALAIVMIFSLLAIIFYPYIEFLVAGYCIALLCVYLYTTVDMAYITEILKGQSNRGFKMSLMNMSNTLPSFIVPVTALSMPYGNVYSSVVMVIGITCLALLCIALPLLFFLREPVK